MRLTTRFGISWRSPPLSSRNAPAERAFRVRRSHSSKDETDAAHGSIFIRGSSTPRAERVCAGVLSVHLLHKSVEVRSKRSKIIKRQHGRDILIRPHHDHAAGPAIDTAHRENVLTILKVRTEHLLVVN